MSVGSAAAKVKANRAQSGPSEDLARPAHLASRSLAKGTIKKEQARAWRTRRVRGPEGLQFAVSELDLDRQMTKAASRVSLVSNGCLTRPASCAPSRASGILGAATSSLPAHSADPPICTSRRISHTCSYRSPSHTASRPRFPRVDLSNNPVPSSSTSPANTCDSSFHPLTPLRASLRVPAHCPKATHHHTSPSAHWPCCYHPLSRAIAVACSLSQGHSDPSSHNSAHINPSFQRIRAQAHYHRVVARYKQS